MESVFLYIAEQGVNYRDFMLQEFASHIRLEGLKLLCPSSSYKLTTERYLKVIKLFNTVLTAEAHSKSQLSNSLKLSSIGLRRTSSDNFSSLNKFALKPHNTLKPHNIVDIQFETASLWDTLETWMNLLQDELNPGSKLHNSNSMIQPLSTRSESSHYQSDCTASYVFTDSLLLCQPAFEYAINQNLCSPIFSRSNSYYAAMETTDQSVLDDLCSISRSNCLKNIESRVNPNRYRRCSLDSTVDRLKFSSAQIQLNSSFHGLVSLETDHFRDDLIIKGNKSPKLPEGEDVLSITADRLCAVIHGYYLFCQSNSLWNNQ